MEIFMFAASVLSGHLGDVIFAIAKQLPVLDITARESSAVMPAVEVVAWPPPLLRYCFMVVMDRLLFLKIYCCFF
jgi:hypothetical protein